MVSPFGCGRQVLDDVSLNVAAGEFVAMLGPNGAGKTTLLRTVLGLVQPERGSIRVAGGPVREAWRHVGYVPQKHAFAWDFPPASKTWSSAGARNTSAGCEDRA